MKKRYLVFIYPEYYPSGGFGDFKQSFDTIDEIKEWLIENHSEYFDIYDQDKRELVNIDDDYKTTAYSEGQPN